MKRTSLNTIKAQNIKIVFDIIARHNNITRNEIAQKSNLSLMTVSKIVDHLDGFNMILHHTRNEPGMVGRKAELLSINREVKKFVIIDLTSQEFTYSILNFDFSMDYKIRGWRYNTNQSYRENLEAFFTIIKEHIEKDDIAADIIGIGVSVPGVYDVDRDIVLNKRITSLMDLKLKSTIENIIIEGVLEDCDVFIDEDVKFAIQANMMMVPDYQIKTIYYMYIGEGVGGAITINGNVFRGSSSFAGDIGQVFVGTDTNFEDLISIVTFARQVLGISGISGNEEDIMHALEEYQTRNTDKVSEELYRASEIVARALFNIIWLIDPHAIIIECKYASLDQISFIENLKGGLSKLLKPARPNIPDIFISDHMIKDSHSGAAIVLRNRWIASIS